MLPHRFTEFAVAVLLTWIAGFVDAVGFLTFAHIYTANMSGNSVALGIALSQYEWGICLFRFWPILFYVCGLVVGRSLIEIGAWQRTRRIASVAFGCEVLLLLIVILFDNNAKMFPVIEWQYAAVALLSTAMGIQNAALTQFSSMTLYTGFVTGTLVNFSEHFVAYATSLLRSLRDGKPLTQALALSLGEKSFRISRFLAFAWIAYIIGAVAGTWGKSLAQSQALTAPIIGLVLLMLLDLYQPLAVEEERLQARLS